MANRIKKNSAKLRNQHVDSDCMPCTEMSRQYCTDSILFLISAMATDLGIIDYQSDKEYCAIGAILTTNFYAAQK